MHLEEEPDIPREQIKQEQSEYESLSYKSSITDARNMKNVGILQMSVFVKTGQYI